LPKKDIQQVCDFKSRGRENDMSQDGPGLFYPVVNTSIETNSTAAKKMKHRWTLLLTLAVIVSCFVGYTFAALTINTGEFTNTTLRSAQYYWKGKPYDE
jgi:hypothetical protein